MKETKFIEVKPDAVNSTIERWANFGWELMGAPQEINYQTTHRTQETDKHYSSEYTTTTNYVKITFQRDNSMPNYKEIIALEQQYNSLKVPPAPYVPVRFGMLWLILTIAGILVYVIPGILIIIFRCVRYSKNKKIYDAEYAEWEKSRDKILSEKKGILNSAKSLLQ
jgi:hypothetical protein